MSKPEKISRWGGSRPGSGRPIKGESKRSKITLSLPSSQIFLFDRLAKDQGISRSEAISEAMAEYVRQHDPIIKRLESAPEEEEALTAEEIAQIEEAKAEARRGEVYTMEEIEREIPL